MTTARDRWDAFSEELRVEAWVQFRSLIIDIDEEYFDEDSPDPHLVPIDLILNRIDMEI